MARRRAGAGALQRPAGFDPADPGAYPAARWDPLDDLVRGARVRGLALLLSPSTPTPAWASRCGGSVRLRSVCRPRPRQYGAFVRALGARYSGAYADENQGRGVLPRVERWSFGNEPNQPSWLRPQFARRSGVVYRGRGGHLPLHGAGGDPRAARHRARAATRRCWARRSPIGRVTGRLATRLVPPARFIRTLLCIDRAGAEAARPCSPASAAAGGFTRLRVTGFAHHPYTQGGSKPPLTRGDPATEITIASAGRLERLLDAGARRGRIPARLPIHYTEHGFQTNPPDRLFGVSPARQAEYINQSDWIAYRDPRVRTVAQYKLLDDTVVTGFQSGLRFWDGIAKPSYDAYRLALWIARKGAGRLRVYGQVRPLRARRAGARGAAERGAGRRRVPRRWRRSRCARRNGTFLRTVPRREGRWRLRWTPVAGPPLLSREAVRPLSHGRPLRRPRIAPEPPGWSSLSACAPACAGSRGGA